MVPISKNENFDENKVKSEQSYMLYGYFKTISNFFKQQLLLKPKSYVHACT